MVYTFALNGLEVTRVSVEADILRGLPYFGIVGLGDTAVKEARERIRSAFLANHLPFPRIRKIINLSPASIPKHGGHFDLPIAIALLASAGYFPKNTTIESFFRTTAVIGELGLDGAIRASGSIFPFISNAQKYGITRCIIPFENAHEVPENSSVEVYPIKHIYLLVESLQKGQLPPKITPQKELPFTTHPSKNWSSIKGQTVAKRALIIAAVGGHNVILRGPPGVGKTILAHAVQEILPTLTTAEKQEVLYRKALHGILSRKEIFDKTPPLKSIDLTTKTGLLCNGPGYSPGLLALAHHGILFLDEIGFYSKSVLVGLRGFLEEKKVVCTQQKKSTEFKTECMVIAAFNPCLCGADKKRCICTPGQKLAYYRRIGSPFFDRFDLFTDVERIPHAVALEENDTDDTEILSKIITQARNHALHRGQKGFNGQLPFSEIKLYCRLQKEDVIWLKTAAEKLSISTRALHRLIKVSRTIADLENTETIKRHHLAEALQYRIRPYI